MLLDERLEHIPEQLMGEHFLPGVSFLLLHLQASYYKVSELVGHLDLLVELKGSLYHVVKQLHLVVAHPGQFSIQKLVGEYTDGPDIAFAGVSLGL